MFVLYLTSFGLILVQNSWYHGSISREETEYLLGNQEDGVFLIRDSIHFVGDHTLSVSCEGRIDHYRILTGPDGLLAVDGGDCSFPSLIELVEVSANRYYLSVHAVINILHPLFACNIWSCQCMV